MKELTIVAVFTVLQVDRSSLGDRSMLLSKSTTHADSFCYPPPHTLTGKRPFITSRLKVQGAAPLLTITTLHSSRTLQRNFKANEKESKKREKIGGGGVEKKKGNSHLDGFQQAHTVTRVIRRNMPPVDRMMYSELRPKPE